MTGVDTGSDKSFAYMYLWKGLTINEVMEKTIRKPDRGEDRFTNKMVKGFVSSFHPQKETGPQTRKGFENKNNNL